ncbi:hypothetical protein WJX81_008505 [Elliptochloris bilobata]|uniref:RNA helicase n=1 Tax=Elliptochloris bilobata TaxID=381761 RepID=A0AAW1QZN4_9CHLO
MAEDGLLLNLAGTADDGTVPLRVRESKNKWTRRLERRTAPTGPGKHRKTPGKPGQGQAPARRAPAAPQLKGYALEALPAPQPSAEEPAEQRRAPAVAGAPAEKLACGDAAAPAAAARGGHARFATQPSEDDDLLDRLPRASGAADNGAPDDVLAAVSALRRRDAALAAAAAQSGADPEPHPDPQPDPGRVPAGSPWRQGAAPAAAGQRAASAAGVGQDSGGAQERPDDEEAEAGGAAPGVVSFVGAREQLAPRKRRRREPRPPEQPPAKKAAASKAQGVPAARIRPGELVHAERDVPAAQRAAVFGAAADTFAGLGLASSLAEHLEDINFLAPTEVQRAAIPVMLAGRDALVSAPTGSGKTLAYLAPIVHDLQGLEPRVARGEGTYALVLVPTRELCLQVTDVLAMLLRRYHWLVGGAVLGGESRGSEKARLRKGVTALVATPGRLLDHLANTAAFRTSELRWLVLDEADRLLDLGFKEKIGEAVRILDERTAAASTRRRQTALLSATLPAGLEGLVSLTLHNPVPIGFRTRLEGGRLRIEPGAAAGSGGAPGAATAAAAGVSTRGAGGGAAASSVPAQLKQRFVEVPCRHRLAALVAALAACGRGGRARKVVVFVSSCDAADFIPRLLQEAGVAQPLPDELDDELPEEPPLLACPMFRLHGNMPQADRMRTFLAFSRCEEGVLCCTDVAARGLDFPAVTSIIQYDPPGEASEYVHRVGRTARLGQQGEALLFLLPSERGYLAHLAAAGHALQELQLLPLLDALPGSQGRHSRRGADAHEGAAELQARLMAANVRVPGLRALAADAFRAHVRAYATHAAATRDVFHVRRLHLGHLAHAFALRESPSLIGGSASKEEKRKRNKEKQKCGESAGGCCCAAVKAPAELARSLAPTGWRSALLAAGADPAAQDTELRSALHHAVLRGHAAVAEALLAAGGAALLFAKDLLGCTPVHLAAMQAQMQNQLTVKLAAALRRDPRGRTPLHEAARRCCMQEFAGFLRAFLGWGLATGEEAAEPTRAGAAAASSTSNGGPHGSVGAGEGPAGSGGAPDAQAWAELAKHVELGRPGAAALRRVMGWSPMHVAAAEGRPAALRVLAGECGCSLVARSANSWKPLHSAAAHNQVGAIDALVQLGCEAAVSDSMAQTPLHVAAAEGHVDAIHALVRLGCDPAARDRDGCTPLYCAAAWDQAEAVLALDGAGCPAWARSGDGRTPLHAAAEQGWEGLLDVLVRRLDSKVDARDAKQLTPLHMAAAGGHAGAVQRLLVLGAEADPCDSRGRTPLHHAAKQGRAAAVEALVQAGADVHARDVPGGYTPLHLAADAGQGDAVAALVALGAPLEARSAKGLTPLALATFKGPANMDAIGALVELGASAAPLTEHEALETPLHIAARCGRVDALRRLLACGMPVTARTKDGSSPLHYAAAFGQAAVVEPLVRAGCSVSCTDDACNTPLHLAAGCGFLETVEALVALAASPAGKTPRGIPAGTAHGSGAAANAANGVNGGATAATVPMSVAQAAAAAAPAGLGLPDVSLQLAAYPCGRAGEPGIGLGLGLGLGADERSGGGAEGGLQLFLRRSSEAWHMSSLEADRKRLVAVAERLVQLGAQPSAVDAEGRTALHLAAGCGDGAMVAKLVALGTDVNCRDSVGGTPMHHAAMAGKQDTMFALARLGCDWRARAEGIDGATAAFVLCGQHGKSSRQQKLVEAKLKRMAAEGAAERAAGRTTAAEPPAVAAVDSHASSSARASNGTVEVVAEAAAGADAAQAAARAALDSAIARALHMLDLAGSASGSQVAAALEALDGAIEGAGAAGVSAKAGGFGAFEGGSPGAFGVGAGHALVSGDAQPGGAAARSLQLGHDHFGSAAAHGSLAQPGGGWGPFG